MVHLRLSVVLSEAPSRVREPVAGVAGPMRGQKAQSEGTGPSPPSGLAITEHEDRTASSAKSGHARLPCHWPPLPSGRRTPTPAPLHRTTTTIPAETARPLACWRPAPPFATSDVVMVLLLSLSCVPVPVCATANATPAAPRCLPWDTTTAAIISLHPHSTAPHPQSRDCCTEGKKKIKKKTNRHAGRRRYPLACADGVVASRVVPLPLPAAAQHGCCCYLTPAALSVVGCSVAPPPSSSFSFSP